MGVPVEEFGVERGARDTAATWTPSVLFHVDVVQVRHWQTDSNSRPSA